MPHNINQFVSHQCARAPTGAGITRNLPDFEFEDKAWRKSCKESAKIPAGYTYLAQLMGHDLGKTVPVDSIPHVQQGPSHREPRPVALRYNLIENPLTLETIYGQGPVGSPHLYHAKNFLFRLGKTARLATKVRFSPDEPAEPLLYDQRNRDTLMLHKMAVVWMQYHNRVARAIMADDGHSENDHLNRTYFFDVFLKARLIVLKAWHQVITQDLLKNVSHPGAYGLPEADLDVVILLDDISVLNGIMRSFHALPLSEYRLNAGLRSSFRELRADTQGERANWRIEWRYFFGQSAANKTGFSASYSFLFTTLSGGPILERDLTSANSAGPLQSLSSGNFGGLKVDMCPDRLESLFNQRAAELGVVSVPKGAFAHIPMFLLLMLEAQFYGEYGSLGPYGSLLLRKYLLSKIASIEATSTPLIYPTGVAPHTSILDVIQFSETHEKERS